MVCGSSCGVRWVLFVDCCLSVDGSLCAVCCSVAWSVRSYMYDVCCVSSTACCLLFDECCLICVVCCLLCVVRCYLLAVR